MMLAATKATAFKRRALRPIVTRSRSMVRSVDPVRESGAKHDTPEDA